MKKTKPESYDQAICELENIVKQIENEEFSMDTLLEKIKQAAELIEFCKQRLKTVDEEVQKIMVKN